MVALQTPVDVVFAQVQWVPRLATNVALLAFVFGLYEESSGSELWAVCSAPRLDVE